MFFSPGCYISFFAYHYISFYLHFFLFTHFSLLCIILWCFLHFFHFFIFLHTCISFCFFHFIMYFSTYLWLLKVLLLASAHMFIFIYHLAFHISSENIFFFFVSHCFFVSQWMCLFLQHSRFCWHILYTPLFSHSTELFCLSSSLPFCPLLCKFFHAPLQIWLSHLTVSFHPFLSHNF